MRGVRKSFLACNAAAAATMVAAALYAVLLVSADAALPPKYQRAQEFSAVIMEASHKLTGDIVKAEFVAIDLYRVADGACSLEVRIVGNVRSGPPIAGPRDFHVESDSPICK